MLGGKPTRVSPLSRRRGHRAVIAVAAALCRHGFRLDGVACACRAYIVRQRESLGFGALDVPAHGRSAPE